VCDVKKKAANHKKDQHISAYLSHCKNEKFKLIMKFTKLNLTKFTSVSVSLTLPFWSGSRLSKVPIKSQSNVLTIKNLRQ
jgi:hypothetical protein